MPELQATQCYIANKCFTHLIRVKCNRPETVLQDPNYVFGARNLPLITMVTYDRCRYSVDRTDITMRNITAN